MPFNKYQIQMLIARARMCISTHKRYILAAALFVVLAGVLTLAWIISAPPSFPANAYITIPADSSGAEFANILSDANIIHSPLAFRIAARISGYDHHLNPGTYVFAEPISLITVVSRIGNGEHGIESIKVTFTEGMTRFDMSATLEEQLPGFDSETFIQLASTSEGYLFPETYLFMPGDAPADIVTRLKLQFSSSIASITPQILSSKRNFSDSIIMASILEREAKGDDKRIVAGILWNRIAKGMPLQVDAVFGYMHQENGYTPTAEDLVSDSPYNTYIRKGFPPTPISNPGLESILAAVTPAKTNYFYYLTGKDGNMYYAVTFEEHKKNRALYLDI